MSRGVGWDWPFPSRGPLTGYAHGAAGIAWALLELASRTGEERFRSAARDAIDYERSLFSSEVGNWPDLRVLGTSPEEPNAAPLRYPTTWCYGAPGIGLARLRCLRHLNDPMLLTEIDTALRTTRTKGFGLSHILCHGDLGNLELFVEAERAGLNGLARFREDEPPGEPVSAAGSGGQGRPPHWPRPPRITKPRLEPLGRTEVNGRAAGILNSIERDGWLCANPRRLESPGLMTGLAGIGYQLLRLARPETVPTVLTLEAPRKQAKAR